MKIGISTQGIASLDIQRLIGTRALIQANSGGGKSTLLRMLAERVAGQVPFIILDWEGEFITLREKVDVVLVGADGEIATDARTANLLARKLIELGASAVIDLGDLEPDRKREYVRKFLDALIHLPRQLWRPTIVCIDEAHQFCPEGGKAASAQSVINLMSLGRKRSFCGVLSTQRLSKIHKDAVSECNNVFIGRTWLDVDQKRAGDTLGMGGNDRQRLRDLREGEFYAFGPALSFNGVELVQVDNAETKAPKVGERHALNLPKASDAVRLIVSHLADLPQQAEDELRSFEDAKREIARLKRELSGRVPVVDEKAIAARDKEWQQRQAALERSVREFTGRIERIAELAHLNGHAEIPAMPSSGALPTPSAREVVTAVRSSGRQAVEPEASLAKGERAILTAIAQHREPVTREQLTILTGYKRSSRDAYLQRLGQKNYVTSSGDGIVATDEGVLALGSDFKPLPTGDELRRYWLDRLGGGERVLLELVADAYPEAVDRESLGEASSYKRSSRDAYLQRLAARKLIVPERGTVKASPMLFG